METRDYLIILYDFYGELFNEKQRLYFENYYLENLSLGEISENLNISRNAVHKSLQSIEEKLLFYEEKLELYKKNKIIWYNRRSRRYKNKGATERTDIIEIY